VVCNVSNSRGLAAPDRPGQARIVPPIRIILNIFLILSIKFDIKFDRQSLNRDSRPRQPLVLSRRVIALAVSRGAEDNLPIRASRFDSTQKAGRPGQQAPYSLEDTELYMLNLGA
jgi:hypothetical protein